MQTKLKAISHFFSALWHWSLMLVSIPWTCLMGIVVTLVSLVHRPTGLRGHRLWGQVICALFGIRLSIKGSEFIPKTGGCIYVANHESMFDIPVLAACPVDFTWVSKAEVKWIPFVGSVIWAMGGFFIQRNSSAKDVNVMKSVEEGIKIGSRVLFFPEGTRTRTGELLPFKKGAFRTAQNAGVPLIPVGIHGTFSIAPPGKLPNRRGHAVTVRFAPPISVPQDANLKTVIQDVWLCVKRLLN